MLLICVFQGHGFAQDKLPEPPAKVDAQEKVEGAPATEEKAVVVDPLKAEFGLSDEAFGSSEKLKELIADNAKTVVKLEIELNAALQAQTKNSTRAEVFEGQLKIGLPKKIRQVTVKQLALTGVSSALVSSEQAMLNMAKVAVARKAGLLGDRLAIVEAEAAKAIEEIKTVDLAKNAVLAEQDAERVLAEARKRESDEADETLKRLLAKQTQLAQKTLALTRLQNNEREQSVESTHTLEKAFSDQKATILNEVGEGKTEIERKRVANTIVARVAKDRRKYRRRLLAEFQHYDELLERSIVLNHELSEAQAVLSEGRLQEESLGESELWQLKVEVAESEVEFSEKDLHFTSEMLAASKVRRVLLVSHLEFFEDQLNELVDLVDAKHAQMVYGLNDEGVKDTILGGQLMFERLKAQYYESIAQASEIDFSVNLLAWVGGLLLRLLPFGFVFFLLPFLPALLGRGYRTALSARTLRKHPGATLKLFEVLVHVARPIAYYAAVWNVAVFVARDFWVFSSIPPFIEYYAFYHLSVLVARVALVPRDARDPLGEFAKDFRLKPQERRLEWLDFGLEKANKIVKSVQVLVGFWVLARIIPKMVLEVFGVGLAWRVVAVLASWSLTLIVYWVISTWRDEIVSVFKRLAETRLPWAVALVEKHNQRFYGVLIIGLASLYVIVFEAIRLGRTYVLNNEWFKRGRNFAFRKRIELQQREREENEVEEAPTVLPPEYRELFTDSALEDAEVFVRRPEQLKTAQRLITNWNEQSRKGSLAMVAEEGMGRTTFITHLLEMEGLFEGHEIVRKRIEEKVIRRQDVFDFVASLLGVGGSATTGDELVEDVRSIDSKVIVLDDCHHLYLRKIGGFEGLDLFLKLVSLTDDHHFWILSFNKYSWDYINRVQTREHQFGAIIDLKPWTEAEIQRLIEFRNARADCSLDFSGLLSTEDDSEDFYEVIRSAKGYFRYLHEFSGGNPRVALLYWLRSLKLSGEKAMVVSLFRNPNTDDFARLTDQHWFVLAALAQHGELNAREVSMVTNAEWGDCKLALNFFSESGFVVPSGNGDRSRLNPLYFRQILKQLTNSNFLYT